MLFQVKSSYPCRSPGRGGDQADGFFVIPHLLQQAGLLKIIKTGSVKINEIMELQKTTVKNYLFLRQFYSFR
jgi:hypothetical protein